MVQNFKVGDHVEWNSEAGCVSGKIVEVHTKNIDYKGYTHHVSKDAPQHEITSDKTDHVAIHKGTALKKFSAEYRLLLFSSNHMLLNDDSPLNKVYELRIPVSNGELLLRRQPLILRKPR